MANELTTTSKVIAGGVIAAALMFGSACSGFSDDRGKGDAPVGETDDSPRDVTNNPDGFPNVVTGCVNGAPGFRYMTTTKGDLEIVPDEECR